MISYFEKSPNRSKKYNKFKNLIQNLFQKLEKDSVLDNTSLKNIKIKSKKDQVVNIYDKNKIEKTPVNLKIDEIKNLGSFISEIPNKYSMRHSKEKFPYKLYKILPKEKNNDSFITINQENNLLLAKSENRFKSNIKIPLFNTKNDIHKTSVDLDDIQSLVSIKKKKNKFMKKQLEKEIISVGKKSFIKIPPIKTIQSVLPVHESLIYNSFNESFAVDSDRSINQEISEAPTNFEAENSKSKQYLDLSIHKGTLKKSKKSFKLRESQESSFSISVSKKIKDMQTKHEINSQTQNIISDIKENTQEVKKDEPKEIKEVKIDEIKESKQEEEKVNHVESIKKNINHSHQEMLEKGIFNSIFEDILNDEKWINPLLSNK